MLREATIEVSVWMSISTCTWPRNSERDILSTVYPKKYAHGFVVLCFVVVMQSLIINSHEVFIHIHQGCFAGIGAIVRLPQCQWSKPDGYGKIGQCITTTKHSKAKTVCIFLGIYCIHQYQLISVKGASKIRMIHHPLSYFAPTMFFIRLPVASAIVLHTFSYHHSG